MAALSISLSEAVSVPVVVGLNVTLMMQLAPGLKVVPQVVLEIVNILALVPAILREKLIRAPAPVFVTVSDFVEVWPRETEP